MTRVTVRVLLTTIIATAGMQAADGQNSVRSLLSHPRLVVAMTRVWIRAVGGFTGVEAAFRLDGTPSDYSVVTARFTNEAHKLRLSISPGETFAIFHVHSLTGDPWPSPGDKAVADRYGITIVTMHRSGVYEYDPTTQTSTRLIHGLQWLIP
jgi:hypothetical protein